jgi:hypothetical protein
MPFKRPFDRSADTRLASLSVIRSPRSSEDIRHEKLDGHETRVVVRTDRAARARRSAAAGLGGEGDLDPSFGNGGVEITDFSGADDYAMGVVLQTDGRIVVVGRSGSSTFHSVRRALTHRAASPTTTSVITGRVLADFSALGDQLNAVALQDDGRIVAVGSVVAGSRPVFLRGSLPGRREPRPELRESSAPWPRASAT